MFDVLKFTDLPRKQRLAAVSAFAETVHAIRFFDLKIGGTNLSERSERFLKRIRGAPTLSNGFWLSSSEVRRAASAAMIETTLHFGKRHPEFRSGYRRFRMISLCPDVGLVDIHQSQFPMQRAKDTMRRALQGKQLQGVGMLDFALFSPGRGLAETWAHIHSHQAVSYDDGRETLNKNWIRLLAPASGNQNALGGPVVYISKQRPKLTPQRAAGLGQYISKESCGANTIYQGKSGQKSECSFTDWTLQGALRQLEFWSYVSVLDACWSTGELGAEMRVHWRRRLFSMLGYDVLPRGTDLDVDATRKGWRRVWRELGVGFEPIDPKSMFATRGPQQLPSCDADDW